MLEFEWDPKKYPDRAARVFLRVIERNPEAVVEAMEA